MRAAFALLFAFTAGPAFADAAPRNPERPSESWSEVIKDSLYPDAEVANGESFIRLNAPYRAHDAGAAPIDVVIEPPLGRVVDRLFVIVDENPAPVAAELIPASGMGRVISLSTRVRVDRYSNIRIVAELDDGSAWSAARYVKASGGCSAPALKDMDEAMAAAGDMRMRLFDSQIAPEAAAASSNMLREAQFMIRHPNYSGMQLNQLTMLMIPAYFIDSVEVTLGEEPVFSLIGGISLSEDPSLRFGFVPNGAPTFTVKATDIDGNAYEGEFPVDNAI